MASENFTILASDLSPQTTSETLSYFFSAFGKIKNIELKDSETGREAVLTFDSQDACNRAVQCSGVSLDNQPITISHHAPPALPEDGRPRQPSAIANVLASGLLLGKKGIEKLGSAANEFDQKHQVSSKAHEFDQKHSISNTASNVYTSAKQTTTEVAQKIDQQLHVREKAQAVSNTAKEYANRAMQNETVAKSVSVLSSWANSVTQAVSTVAADTRQVMAEREQAERQRNPETQSLVHNEHVAEPAVVPSAPVLESHPEQPQH